MKLIDIFKPNGKRIDWTIAGIWLFVNAFLAWATQSSWLIVGFWLASFVIVDLVLAVLNKCNGVKKADRIGF